MKTIQILTIQYGSITLDAPNYLQLFNLNSAQSVGYSYCINSFGGSVCLLVIDVISEGINGYFMGMSR